MFDRSHQWIPFTKEWWGERRWRKLAKALVDYKRPLVTDDIFNLISGDFNGELPDWVKNRLLEVLLTPSARDLHFYWRGKVFGTELNNADIDRLLALDESLWDWLIDCLCHVVKNCQRGLEETVRQGYCRLVLDFMEMLHGHIEESSDQPTSDQVLCKHWLEGLAEALPLSIETSEGHSYWPVIEVLKRPMPGTVRQLVVANFAQSVKRRAEQRPIRRYLRGADPARDYARFLVALLDDSEVNLKSGVFEHLVLYFVALPGVDRQQYFSSEELVRVVDYLQVGRKNAGDTAKPKERDKPLLRFIKLVTWECREYFVPQTPRAVDLLRQCFKAAKGDEALQAKIQLSITAGEHLLTQQSQVEQDFSKRVFVAASKLALKPEIPVVKVQIEDDSAKPVVME